MGKTYWRYGVTNQAHAVGRTCLSQQSCLALGTVTERKSNCYDIIILISFPNFKISTPTLIALTFKLHSKS